MKKKALLVGIDKYPDPRDGLRGCVNDVRLMEATLRGEYGFSDKTDIRILVDSNATTGAILDGLAWLSSGAGQGDSLVFHYSGHGSEVLEKRRGGDETADGFVEILCPCDLDWDRPLTDDHLASVCAGIPRGALFTVILDCCHSGTGPRGTAVARPGGPVRPRFISSPSDPSPPARRSVRRFGVSVTKACAVLLAACRENQTCADAPIGAAWHGAHTYYLCRALRHANWIAPYRALAASMSDALSRAGFDQIPRLEGPNRLTSSRFLEPPPNRGARRETGMRIGLPLLCR